MVPNFVSPRRAIENRFATHRGTKTMTGTDFGRGHTGHAQVAVCYVKDSRVPAVHAVNSVADFPCRKKQADIGVQLHGNVRRASESDIKQIVAGTLGSHHRAEMPHAVPVGDACWRAAK